MTDQEWENLIRKCRSKGDEYWALLKQAEAEYEARYGHNPSDVDNDYWIDTLHYGHGGIDIAEIKRIAEHYSDITTPEAQS
jgi:hypothetical protein